MKSRRGGAEGDGDRGNAGAAWPSEQDQLASAAATEFAGRRRRGRHFRFGTLSELAWDLLLALYIERHREAHTTLDRLVETGDAAPTTNLRLLGILIEDGLARIVPRGRGDETRVMLSEWGVDEIEHHLRRRIDPTSMASAANGEGRR